jgi:hypothetical protein
MEFFISMALIKVAYCPANSMSVCINSLFKYEAIKGWLLYVHWKLRCLGYCSSQQDTSCKRHESCQFHSAYHNFMRINFKYIKTFETFPFFIFWVFDKRCKC